MILLFILSVLIGMSIALFKVRRSNKDLLNYYIGQQDIKKLQNMKTNKHYKLIELEDIGKINKSDA